jgi:hypothetical protein
VPIELFIMQSDLVFLLQYRVTFYNENTRYVNEDHILWRLIMKYGGIIKTETLLS